jgi:hypothetical protein
LITFQSSLKKLNRKQNNSFSIFHLIALFPRSYQSIMKLTSFISHVALALLLCLVMTASSWAGTIGTVDLEQDLPQQDMPSSSSSSSNNLAVASSLSLRGRQAPPLDTTNLDQRYLTLETVTSLFNMEGPASRGDIGAIGRYTYIAFNAEHYQKDEIRATSYKAGMYRQSSMTKGDGDLFGEFEVECGPTCSKDNDFDPWMVVLAKAESGFYDEEWKSNSTRVAARIEAATLTGNAVGDTLCNELRKSGIRKFKSVRGCRIKSSSRWEMNESDQSWTPVKLEGDIGNNAEDIVSVLAEE